MKNIPHDRRTAHLCHRPTEPRLVLVVGIPPGTPPETAQAALDATLAINRLVVAYDEIGPGKLALAAETISTVQAAQALSCSDANLRRLLAAGRFPATHQGPAWRINREDVDTLLRFQVWPFPAGRPRHHQEPE